MVTQKKLKELLHYNPDSGVFTRLVSSGAAKAGSVLKKNCNGYIQVRINNKKYIAHHLAWLYVTGELPENQIDHKNHIRDDNRWTNLREATHLENSKNQSKRVDNISGVTGVHWNKAEKRWRGQIGTVNTVEHLGSFKDKFEAICARKSAENKHDYHENHGA